jgi:predicted transcriptional regulator
MERDKMKKKKQKTSLAQKIMKVLSKQPMAAENVKEELKDTFGYNEKLADVRVNLLYLLRREKIGRKKDGKIYKYHI